MDLAKAKSQQEELQQEAMQLLEALQLQSHYSQIGELHKTGSYSYGLMVVRDIDFDVFVDNSLQELDKIGNLATKLLNNDLVRKISVVKNGYNSPPDAGKPVGIWIGIQSVFNKNLWNMDIWVVQREQAEAINLGFDMQQITQEQKDTMLLLKAQLQEQNRYGHKNDYYSADIYKAVYFGNVKTIEELDNYQK